MTIYTKKRLFFLEKQVKESFFDFFKKILEKLAQSNYNNSQLFKTNFIVHGSGSLRPESLAEGKIMMPLSLADLNTSYTIRRISGNDEVKKHLETLGFTVGSDVTLVSRLGGNVIIKVKESRVGINESLARRIFI